MTTQREPLKPCPFCSGIPTLEEKPNSGVGMWTGGLPPVVERTVTIRCDSCGIPHLYRSTEVKLHASESEARAFIYTQAATVWNLRPTPNAQLTVSVFPIATRPEDGQYIFYWFEPFGTWHAGRYDKASDSVYGRSGFTSVIPEVPFWMPEFEPQATPNAVNDVTLYRELLACAYQLAGLVGAPVKWLDALSNGAEGKLEREVINQLLPITQDQLDPNSFVKSEDQ
ncbi:hypothetical protein [Ralstonia phage phiRSL1]|uniref:Restriction alleviation protein Lar n=1 Tax=Ralstonia phage phiRSL1 TaxID=1980924 RepID=B2ZXW8_9CAUD|nr:hypothetical protein RSL1_ORF099 [Ralstonia phage phiRSL1]BAG41544.1 hypothetical protein [Ralstonia phage phiRSL1]